MAFAQVIDAISDVTYIIECPFSDTAPGEGTLQVFPDVLLSNAYTIMRPFFKLKSSDADPMAADSWELGQSLDFPVLSCSSFLC